MINNTSIDGEVTSLAKLDIDTSGLSPQEAEAHNMLHQLKYQRGISSQKYNNVDINNVSSRSLKDMEKTTITFANTNNGQTLNNNQQISLDDSLLQAFNNNINDNFSDNNYANDANDINDDNDDNDYNENISLDSIVKHIQEEDNTINNSQFLKSPFNGITKPLLINSPDNINPVNAAFKELFNPEMWTSIGRR